jgi:hypothetical protein
MEGKKIQSRRRSCLETGAGTLVTPLVAQDRSAEVISDSGFLLLTKEEEKERCLFGKRSKSFLSLSHIFCSGQEGIVFDVIIINH